MGLWRLMDDWNVFFCFTWARWRFLFYRSPINKHKDSAETWRRISRSSGSATDKQNGRPRLSNNEPRLDPWQLYSKQIPYFTLIAFAPLSLCLRQKRIIQKSPNSLLYFSGWHTCDVSEKKMKYVFIRILFNYIPFDSSCKPLSKVYRTQQHAAKYSVSICLFAAEQFHQSSRN